MRFIERLKELFRRRPPEEEAPISVEEEKEVSIEETGFALRPRSISVPYPHTKVAIVMSVKGGVGKSTIVNAMLSAFGLYTVHDCGLLDFELGNCTATRMILTKKKYEAWRSGVRFHETVSLACALLNYIRGATQTFQLPRIRPLSIVDPRYNISWTVLVIPSATLADHEACVRNGLARYGARTRAEISSLVPEIVRMFVYEVLSKPKHDCKFIVVDTPPLRPVSSEATIIEFEHSLPRLATIHLDRAELNFVVVLPPEPYEAFTTLSLISSKIPMEKISLIIVSKADVHAFKLVVNYLRKMVRDLDVSKIIRVPYNEKWEMCYRKSLPITVVEDISNPSDAMIAILASLCKLRVFPDHVCTQILSRAEELSLLVSW